MSTNIFKINELLENFSLQGQQIHTMTPLDYFFYGYMLSLASISKLKNFSHYIEDLFKKILYINDLCRNNIFSFKQKLTLLQDIMTQPLDRLDILIDNALDGNFGGDNNTILKKIYSSEERKLSEDFIQKMIEEEENRHKEEMKLSENLIKKLEEEEKANKELIREIKEQELEQKIDCPICLSSLFSGNQDVWGLMNCEHCFHKECLNPYLEAEISNKRFPIKCPMENCKAEVSNADLMENIEKDVIEKYLDFTLKNYVDIHGHDMSWCPTADCNYAFIYDEDITILNCPRCNNSYCLKCRVPEHKGMTCKEYQVNSRVDKNDVMFFDFVKGHKFKQCTQCQYWVEKNEGCDHMTCRCGYQFCYKCGGKYMECECVRKANPIHPIPVARPIPVGGNRGNKVNRGKNWKG